MSKTVATATDCNLEGTPVLRPFEFPPCIPLAHVQVLSRVAKQVPDSPHSLFLLT